MSGCYVAQTGRSFETPALIRYFRSIGGDAVGMSTAPEAMLGHAAGLRVLGLSCITNWAAGISAKPLGIEEMKETFAAVMPRIRRLLLSYFGAG
jgi:purine-nucleoside phosphorylase